MLVVVLGELTRYHHKTREPHAKPLMDKAGVEELKERKLKSSLIWL